MKTLKKLITVLTVSLFSMMLFALSPELELLNGQTLGVVTGSSFDAITQSNFPKSELLYYNSLPDVLQALKTNKIASFMYDEPVIKYMTVQDPSVAYYDDYLSSDQYAMGIAKTESGDMLLSELNEYLDRITANGVLQELHSKWFSTGIEDYVVEYESLPSTNGFVKGASSFTNTPFGFISNGKYSGLEVEILYNFCKEHGYGLSFQNVDISARIPALISGKVDVIFGCMTITEERKQSINFTTPTYVGGSVMTYIKAEDSVGKSEPFFSRVSTSFRRNFIEEDRYKLVLSGLDITIRISILSAIFGTVFGFGICMLRRSENKVLSSIAAVFIRLVQGLPVVVLLMILYYIVFKTSRISGEIVAIIGFSLNFGVYVSEMMRTGIDAVDKGQIEASKAMGFNPIRTFVKITTPQALRQIIPVYKGEFISMVKMTSVVGYIAIQDLTKAGDIIRSRTYDAFFPLIFTAIIYFLVAYVFVFLLGRVEIQLDPEHRKNILKGVIRK